MKYKNERKEKVNVKEKILNDISGITFQSYIKSTYTFIKNNLSKMVCIMMVLALLGIASLLINPESLKADMTNVTFGHTYFETIKVIAIVVLSGIAPYLYAPIIGIGYTIFLECMYMANLVLKMGYIKGIAIYIVPFMLNVLIMAIASAIGIYMCKNITLGHRITNIKTTNSMDLRMSIYEAAKKIDKKNAIDKKRKDKIAKLESKKQELDLFQIINVTVILCVVQLGASLIKSLVI